MRSDRPIRRFAWFGALTLLGLIAAGCDNGGGGGNGGSGLTVSMSFVPPGAGQDVLWLAEGQRDGDLLIVDVMARDITQPFDAYEIEVTFDPLVLRASSTEDGGILFSCTGVAPLPVDNIGSAGGDSGSLLVSAVSQVPASCTTSGDRVLARLAFRAIGSGTSALAFVPFSGDPVDPHPGSRLFLTSTGPEPVPVTFFDSQALVISQHS